MRHKVLFVSHDGNISGSIISMVYLLKAFKNQSIDPYVLLPQKASSRQLLTSIGVQCVHSPIFSGYSFGLNVHFVDTTKILSLAGLNMIARNIAKWILGVIATVFVLIRIRPSMVYLNEYVSLQSALISFLFRVPCVSHVRSRFLIESYPLRRTVLANMLVFLNVRLFAISSIEAEQFRGLVPEKALEKITVVPEFLDEHDFGIVEDSKNIRSSMNLPETGNIVLMLGGIDPLKGTLDFLNAAKRVLQDGLTVTFIAAGRVVTKGTENQEYYQRCNTVVQSIENRSFVRIYDEIIDVAALIGISDIVVSCNTQSHFSRPIIEAWAKRKAVIATNTDHSVALIEDGVDGMLYRSGDDSMLADTIRLLLNDQQKRMALGRRGYNKAVGTYGNGINERMIIDRCLSIVNRE